MKIPISLFAPLPDDLHLCAAHLGGVIVKSEDDHFRGLRNDYLSRFNRHTDDYLQYAPAAFMLGMKVADVEGLIF